MAVSVGPPLDAAQQAVLDGLTSTTNAGAVAFVRTRLRSSSGASGIVDRDTLAAPDDSFAIASTEKTFVAVIVLQLVGAGQLSLEDVVEARLPGRVKDGQKITIRMLLNHTSGIPQNPTAALLPLDQQPGLLWAPGTRHQYSNVNYTIARNIAEAATGSSMDILIRDRILRPLSLDQTSVGDTWANTPAERHWLGATAGAGIGTTAADLATFFEAIMDGRLLADAELQEMLTTVPVTQPFAGSAAPSSAPEASRAGLGIFGFDLPCGEAWGHGGDLLWYSNQVLVSRDGSKVSVVAQNVGGWALARAAAVTLYCS